MIVEISPSTAVTLQDEGLLLKPITFEDICHDNDAAFLWINNQMPIHIEAFVDRREQLIKIFDKMSTQTITLFVNTYSYAFNRIDIISALLVLCSKNEVLTGLIDYLFERELEENKISEVSLVLYILSSTNLAAYHKYYCNKQLLDRAITFIENSSKETKESIAKVNDVDVESIFLGDYIVHSYMMRLSKCMKNLLQKDFNINEIEMLFNLKKAWNGDYEIFYNKKTFDLEIRQKNTRYYWALTQTKDYTRNPNDYLPTNLIFRDDS
jgi:hypothetical protein